MLMFVAYLGMFYAIIYLLHTFLRGSSRTSLSYLVKLRSVGLEISLGQVKWTTARFNSSLYWWSQIYPQFCSLWFKTGAVISCIMMIPSLAIVCYSLIQSLVTVTAEDNSDNSNSHNQGPALQPIVPGVNLPTSQLVYYLISLLVSSVYHEAGHAVAAYSCNIRMLGAGIFIMAIFPAAFVELPTEQLNSRSARQQLSVYCAGVWHNIVLALVAWLLYLMSSGLLSPLYHTGTGVSVTDVAENSVISGPSGLKTGDIITSIQGHPVHNTSDFKKQLASTITHHQVGFCLTDRTIKKLDIKKSGSDCCPEERSDSFCFDRITKKSKKLSKSCLPVRSIVNKLSPLRKSSFCPCSSKHSCWNPRLENDTKLVIVGRKGQKEYILLGNPGLIYKYSSVTNFIPNFDFLPLSLPDILLKLLRFIAAFSSGLAVLNLVPSYLLDGHHIARALVEMFLPSCSSETKLNIVILLSLTGTVLIAANIVIGLLFIMTSNNLPYL